MEKVNDYVKSLNWGHKVALMDRWVFHVTHGGFFVDPYYESNCISEM